MDKLAKDHYGTAEDAHEDAKAQAAEEIGLDAERLNARLARLRAARARRSPDAIVAMVRAVLRAAKGGHK